MILRADHEFFTQFVVAPSAPSTLYAAKLVQAPTFAETFHASQDGGASLDFAIDVPALISVLVVDPTAPQTLYFTLADTSHTQPGLFKSTDGGKTKTLLLQGQQAAFSLAVDPTNPQTLYVGTTNDVIVSRDGGATWAELAPGLPPMPIEQLLIGPGGVLYAQVPGNGVYRAGL